MQNTTQRMLADQNFLGAIREMKKVIERGGNTTYY
jgi:hypothetical protein